MKRSYHLKLGKGFTLHLHHPFKLSEAGYFHFLILGFSIGKEGFSIAILGFSFGLGWREY